MKKHTQIPLANPAKAINKLCKHFSHKVKAEWDESQGKVHFPMGLCYFKAEDNWLHVLCEADEKKATNAVAQIVETHVFQMSWKEVDKEQGLVWEGSAVSN
tara:strand:+ start:462 stop:764 length:303 start_codon:yes stop_codon:yes gene_type:complete